MRRIRIPNPRLLESERTFLDADYTTLTTLTVVSNLGFAANNYAVVGETGEEKTEASPVSSITSNTTITLVTAYKFSHNKSTSLYRSEWNQVAIERKLHTSSTWAALVTQDIQWDKLETLYVDSTGDDTYDYRFRFYNSTSASYSEYSPTVSGAGFSPQQVGAMILHVREKIKDPNRARFTDTRIIEQLQAGQLYIPTLIPDLWFLRVDTFEASNGIAAVASTSKYSLAQYTDYAVLAKIKYKYVSGNTFVYDLEGKNDIEFDRFTYNQLRVADDNVVRFKLLPPDSSSSKGYFTVDPVPKTTGIGTFYPIYYRALTALNSVEDTTDLTYPEILEDYAAWKLHTLMGNTGEAQKYEGLFFGEPSVIHAGRLNFATKNITGIELLKLENNMREQGNEYPRNLWKWRGRRSNTNYYRRGLIDRDFIKENYM